MNRKLHNTILAFSVTGVMLFVGLVVAEPALPAHDGHDAVPFAAGHGREAGQAARISTGTAITPDAAGDDTEAMDAAEAIAMATGLLAVSVTEAALDAMLADLETANSDRRQESGRDGQRKDPPSRRKGRASRDLIAVPYFSFARGSRGSRS